MNSNSSSNSTQQDPADAPVVAPRPSNPALIPLLLAGLFMICGLSVLVYLGREKSRLIGAELVELDIKPLLNTDRGITTEDMKGRIVVLHFWGVWCGPCVHEYPEFIKLQTKYQDNDSVLFVSISCGSSSPENMTHLEFGTKKFLAQIGNGLPVYCDPAEYSRFNISQLLSSGGFSYPTTIVIGADGKVSDIWAYAIDMSKLENSIERELKKVSRGAQ